MINTHKPYGVYEKYFKDIKAKDVAGIVENALAVWFSEERDNV